MQQKLINNCENKEIKYYQNSIPIKQKNVFIENGGYFPNLTVYKNKFYIFCRTHAGHLGKEGKISLVSSLNAKDWVVEKVISAEDAVDIRNPAVGVLKDGSFLVCAYKYDAYYGKNSTASPSSTKSNFGLVFYRSDTNRLSWQKQKDISISKLFEEHGPFCPHGKMQYHYNKLVMPVYNNSYASVLISSDHGKSWEKIQHIAHGYREPSITVAKDGHLIAVMRGNPNVVNSSATFISHCYDKSAKIWSTPEIITAEENHPADILKLFNGDLVLTVSSRNNDQQCLLVYYSVDNGKTWNIDSPMLLGDVYKNSDFGYPSVTEYSPGKILTAFYLQEGRQDGSFNFSDAKKYNPKGAKGIVIEYDILDLLGTYHNRKKINIINNIF